LETKKYFTKKFESFTATADLYVSFIEQGIRLLRDGGLFGYIVSNKWMRANYGKGLRTFIKKYQIEKLIDFGELPVFSDAATFLLIMIIKNTDAKDKPLYSPIKRLTFDSLNDEVSATGFLLDDGALSENGFSLVKADSLAIIEKMKSVGVPLGTYKDVKIFYGINTGFNEAFVINGAKRDELIAKDPKSAEIIKPLAFGDDIRKYHIKPHDSFIIFSNQGIDINRYPEVLKHLQKYRERLTPKPKDWIGEKWHGRASGDYQWYEIQSTVAYYNEFDKPKIIYPDIAKESRFFYDKDGLYLVNTCYFIPSNDIYLCGLINSKILWYHYKKTLSVLGDVDKGGRLRFFTQFMESVPIRPINPENPDDVAAEARIISLVTDLLSLHKTLANEQSPARKKTIEKQIEDRDKEIDQIVYKLYGLTEEEIRIVEGESTIYRKSFARNVCIFRLLS
jgi:hypothetical protein